MKESHNHQADITLTLSSRLLVHPSKSQLYWEVSKRFHRTWKRGTVTGQQPTLDGDPSFMFEPTPLKEVGFF